MPKSSSVAEKKLSPADVIEAKLVTAYEAATAADKTAVADLINRAKGSQPDSTVMQITPGMAALLFFDHNKQNREWNYGSTVSYLQQIENQEWEFTCQGIGFLVNGNAGDGQHRLAAIALGGVQVLTLVAFGMSEKSIIALDTGRRRQASDYLHIIHPEEDTSDVKRMQQMITRAFGFLAKDSDEERRRPYVLRTNRDRVKAVETNKPLLRQAITLAKDSVRGRAKPPFSEAEAAAYAFLLLVKGWPVERVTADLDQFQSGEDREGSDSPLFIAAQTVAKDAAKREKSTITARFGAAVKGFILHEEGVSAVRPSVIKEAMKPKHWPNPVFPTQEKPAE